MMRKILMFVAVVLLQEAGYAYNWDDVVASLPDASSEAITNGLLFLNGEYVPPPYMVTRHGVGIYINGHHVWTFATNPFPELKTWDALEQESMPSVPTGIVESTRLDSPLCREYFERASIFLVTKRGADGSIAEFAEAVKTLPNVGEVTVSNGVLVVMSKSGDERYGVKPLRITDVDSWKYYAYALAKSGALAERGRKAMDSFAEDFRKGAFVSIGLDGILSGYGFAEKFQFLLPLIDKGASNGEIVALNTKGDQYGTEIIDRTLLESMLTHRDSLLTEEFRRRLFGEYWQTYGVKPETEEERIERLYRGVTYEERTAESFGSRLESLEYNTKVQYGDDTNRWPEASIESVDRFRREYAEHVAERDAAWAALSESDRAIIRARLDKEKADAEAEKQRKLRVEAEAEIARLYTKIFSRIKDDFSSDFPVERIEEIAHETAQEEYVFSALVAYYSMKGVFPSDLSVLISYVYQGDLLLFDGARYTVDQWGRSYRYTLFMDRQLPSARLTSAGPDGKFDTEDDITTTRKSWAANLR